MEQLEDRTLLSTNPTFTVDLLGDAGIGQLQYNSSGQIAGGTGDIRFAVTQANNYALNNPGSVPIITFDTQALFPTTGGIGTIFLNTNDSYGDLEISADMDIEGPTTGGLTISGDGNTAQSRVFNITAITATVTISNLIITGGNASPGGTGVTNNQGGDIFNGGNLTLINDIVEDGNTGGIGGVGRGGGIFNAEGQPGHPGATLILENTIVKDNNATAGTALGGGIYNDVSASLTVEDGSIIENNTATGSVAQGGGIWNAGIVNITGTNASVINLEDNQAVGIPGGTLPGFGLNGGDGTPGGNAQGGGIYNTIGTSATAGGSVSLSNVRFLGNQAKGGQGGPGGKGGTGTQSHGTPGGNGGNGGPGGIAQGGGLFNGSGALSLTVANVQFGVDGSGVGNQAVGGQGGIGGNGGAGRPNASGIGGHGGWGGAGGVGGTAQGGGIYNAASGPNFNSGKGLTLTNTTFTDSEAIGGDGNDSGTGGPGGKATKVYYQGGAGGGSSAAGDGGAAEGGAVYNSFTTANNLNFVDNTFTGNIATGGKGGTGQGGGVGGTGGPTGKSKVGTASITFPGGTGGRGGDGGAGGNGGAAQGGGFYNLIGAVTVTSSSFTDSQAVSGAGGAGGQGGLGGQGGDASSPPKARGGYGGPGGYGGAGGDAGTAAGGAGYTSGGNVSLTDVSFTSSLVQTGDGGPGGGGGNGGPGGDSAPIPTFGGAGGTGGTGGNSANGSGGAIAVVNANLNTSGGTTFGSSGNSALGSQIIGGNGGAGGLGGSDGPNHHPSSWQYPYVNTGRNMDDALQNNPNETAGNGGNGGNGASVQGGAVSVNGVPQPGGATDNTSQTFAGLKNTGGFAPPDTQGAAGPNSYVEATNQSIAIYSFTGVPISPSLSLSNFFNTLTLPTPATGDQNVYLDPFVVYDPNLYAGGGGFIVGDMVYEASITGNPVTGGPNELLLAVSKNNNPGLLTAAAWNFYEIQSITPPKAALEDYASNPGYNAGGLVITQNSLDAKGNPLGTLITAIPDTTLTVTPSGAILGNGLYFQNEYTIFDNNPSNPEPLFFRAAAGAPGNSMWFVAAPNDGMATQESQIYVMNMTNVFSDVNSGTNDGVTPLTVSSYYQAVLPLQPNGLPIGSLTGRGQPETTPFAGLVPESNLDSRITNVAAQMVNGQLELVAAQTVSDFTGDEDSVQWYEINAADSSPVLQQQGDVSGGTGVFDFNPGIAINSSGDIGMSYLQSESAGEGGFMSMYITGRSPSDPIGSMDTPQLVQAGLSNYTYFAGLLPTFENDASGINVAANGSFWAANEYANSNWATEVANFTVTSPTAPPVQTVNINNSSFYYSSITSGNGGAGGQAGLFSFDGANAGFNGTGGNAGLAEGGAVALNATTTQDSATLNTDTIESSTATAGNGGAGTLNYLGAVFGLSIPGGNGFGSNGGNGGSVEGVGLAGVNYNFTVTASSFDGGVGTAGSGGDGGGSSKLDPRSWAGGAGGVGGTVQGGGVYFYNNLAAQANFSFNGGSASGNQLAGGNGGNGGNAGASTTPSHQNDVTGGAGGAGGAAQGGGLYVFAGSQSINNVTLTNISLLGDEQSNNSGTGGYEPAGGTVGFLTAGNGGTGGAGFNAPGGAGGNAQGGAVYNSSQNANVNQTSTLTLTDSALAGWRVISGNGGAAGSGTTVNGGAGGAGGNAGNADGGGLYNGDNTLLSVINTTFGGGDSDSSNPETNYNILEGGVGGVGGNAGTANTTLISANGGAGGGGGSVLGGNVYNSSTGASFINDTNVYGQAIAIGHGVAGGSGAGSHGIPGKPGLNGISAGGGYYAAPGSSASAGNTILDFNAAIQGADVAAAPFSLTVSAPNSLTLPTASVGNFYNQTITASGGTGALTVTSNIPFTVVNGVPTQVVDGLTFTPSGSSLNISGTPTATETINFTVTVEDSSGDMAERNYTLIVNPFPFTATNTSSPPTTNTFTSQGTNLFGGIFGFTAATSDQTGVSATALPLGPLQNNGGPTPTDALLHTIVSRDTFSGNVAIAAGNTALVPPNITTDQRGTGFPRLNQDNPNNPGANAVDIGAFEVQPTTAITFSPTVPPGLPPAAILTPYNQTITTGGGTGTLTVTTNPSPLNTALPGGLTSTISPPGSAPTLTISGTPTGTGASSANFSAIVTDTNGDVATQPYTLSVVPPITLSPTSLPSVDVGSTYNQTITATSTQGTLSLSYTVTSTTTLTDLGLSITGNGTSTLTITGTGTNNAPTAAGTVTFSVTATDSDGATDTQNYTITVDPQLTLTPTTLPAGSVGALYDVQIVANGGSGAGNLIVGTNPSPLTLPSGLTATLNGNTLTIKGTPTTTGTVTFSVTATDTNGSTFTGSYTLTVDPAISITPTSLPAAGVGVPYSQTITASGGTGTLTLTTNPTNLNGLLSGLGLTSSISGTSLTISSGSNGPTASGTVTFSVIATDGNGAQVTQNYTLTVNPAGTTITFSPTTLPEGTAGDAYGPETITASENGGNNNLTLSYNITNGSIPTGMMFTVSGNQLTISGTPGVNASGSVSFNLKADDGNGHTATQFYTLTINPAILFAPTTLPPGLVGSNYTQTITVSGGSGNLSLTTTPATLSLPAGLTASISNNTLTISGTPTASGTASFTLNAKDNTDGATASENYVLTINPAISFSPSPANLPSADQNSSYSQTITASGGNGALTLTDNLPNNTLGLAFSINNNKLSISGTPTAQGTINFSLTATDQSGNTNTQNYTLTVNPAISFSPTTLPAAAVGTAYTQTITASGGSGSSNLTLTDSLPANTLGLTFSISNNTLTINGKPSASGTVSFSVTATDSNGATATQNYTLTVGSSSSSGITFSPSTLPAAAVGQSYSQTITASGGSGPLTLTDSVPSNTDGLTFTISDSTLTISGTPTATGTVSFSVTATDTSGNSNTANYSLTVNSSTGAISFSPTTLPNATQGKSYSQTITASGGTGTLTLTDSVPSNTLGLNFTINGSTLTISGTPTTAGGISFSVTATDSSGDTKTQNYTLTINSTSGAAISFSPTTLPNATQGQSYSQTITASGGTGTLTLTDSVPSNTLGLNFTINGSTLTISGTPTTTGTFNFTVTASDGHGDSSTQSYALTVNSASTTTTITLNPPGGNLPNGSVDTFYSQTITASGGNGTLTLSDQITSGGLPAGLSLTINGNTLTISGTPTAVGSVGFSVTAKDTSGNSTTQNYTLTVGSSVSPPPPPPSFATTTTIVSVQNTYVGFMQEETVTAEVTDSAGIPISQGVVAFQVDNQTVYAPVINGFATATIDTFVLDLSILVDLLFDHTLTATYEGSGSFAASPAAATSVPAILLDFFLYEITLQLEAALASQS